MKIKKNKSLLFSIIIFFLSLLVFVFAILLNQFLILEKKEISTTLKVGDTAAFDLDNSTLSFGMVTPGTTSSRRFEIENNYPFTIVAHLDSVGNISRFLTFEKKIKILPKEKKMINIGTILPVEKDYGGYSGKMIITLKREM